MFLLSLFSIIALGGLASLFGAQWFEKSGYAKAVLKNKDAPPPTLYFKKFFWAPFIPLIIVILFESYTIVPQSHVGVQVILGKVNMEALDEGFHIVDPRSSVQDIDVRIVKAQLEGSQAGTKDLQVVHTDIVVNYRKKGSMAPYIVKEVGPEVENKLLLPAMSESFKAVTAHYNSEELITKRDIVSEGIKTELQSKVAPYGLEISGISLVNFGFSKEYQTAIEQKVISVQATQKAEQDLKRIKIEAEQNIAQADGEAKAIAIQAQAIASQGGAAYVQMKAIDKWDGKLPETMAGAMPFINVGAK